MIGSGMSVPASLATRQQSCKALAYPEVAMSTISGPETVINPAIESYRFLSATVTHGVRFLEQVLNYSKNTPIAQRTITKLVIYQSHYAQLRRPGNDGVSLYDKLLQEGVEIISVEKDILPYINDKYPGILKALEMFVALYKSDRPEPIIPLIMRSGILDGIVFDILADFAFSSGVNKNLKTVVVIKNQFMSSLFLSADDVMIEVVSQYVSKEFFHHGEKELSFFDKSIFKELMIRCVDGVCNDQVDEPVVQVYLNPDYFIWTNSPDSARLRANTINSTFAGYIDNVSVFGLSDNDFINGKREGKLSEWTTLNELFSKSKDKFSMVCYRRDVAYQESMEYTVHCYDSTDPLLHSLIDTLFIHHLFKCLIPEIKKNADGCNVKTAEPVFTTCTDAHWGPISVSEGVIYLFRTKQPEMFFWSEKKENMDCFIQKTFLNITAAFKIKYFCWEPGETGSFTSSCSPVITKSDFNKLIVRDDYLAEWAKIDQAMKRFNASDPTSYSDYSRRRASGDDSKYISGDTVYGLVSPFTQGLATGVCHGIASYFDVENLVRNPLFTAASGYFSGGVPGAFLGGVGGGISYTIPARLRAGAEPGSWRSGGAMLVESLSMTLSALFSGVCPYLVSVGGYMVGKYATKCVLRLTMPSQDDGRKNNYQRKKRRTRARSEQRTKPAVRQKLAQSPAQAETGNVAETKPSSQELLAGLAEELWSCSDRERGNTITGDIEAILKQLEIKGIENLQVTLLEVLADKLPLSLKVTADVITAYSRKIENKWIRADYLDTILEQYEEKTGGSLSAVEEIPGLYVEYLKVCPLPDIDFNRVGSLWGVLSSCSQDDWLVKTGGVLIQTHLRYAGVSRALDILADDKLNGKLRMAIFSGLDREQKQVLLQQEVSDPIGVPEILGEAYLEQVKGKSAKQIQKKHMVEAADQWLTNFSIKPDLTDKLVQLSINFRLTPEDNDETRNTYKGFKEKLNTQVQEEIPFKPGDNVLRCLRAKAIEIALKTDSGSQ